MPNATTLRQSSSRSNDVGRAAGANAAERRVGEEIESTSAKNKAAGGVLTAKQAPHRPGTAPALGLRAGCVVAPIVAQTTIRRNGDKGVPMSSVEVEDARRSADAEVTPSEQKGAPPTREVRHEYTH